MAVDVPVTLTGNLTRDPELRYTPNGQAVCTFSIAINKRVKDGDTWKDGTPHYFDVKVWGQFGENCAESLRKGVRVVVYGELQQRTWETDGGEKRSKDEINAESVGADLRWATSQVQRNERTDGNSQGQQRSSGSSRQAKPAAKPPTAGLTNPFGN